ncbi:MAG: ATP synthase subunit I [Candidatus Sedimenticola endophacoides]
MHLADNSQAVKVVQAQFAVSFLAALILLAAGWVPALSLLLGGLCAAIANGLFAARVFVKYSTAEPGRLLARMYGAELLKFAVTVLIFAAAILLFGQLSIGAMIGGYLLVAVVPIVYTLFHN